MTCRELEEWRIVLHSEPEPEQSPAGQLIGVDTTDPDAIFEKMSRRFPPGAGA